MKEYYLDRIRWIFGYTRKTFLYCVFKTLCLIVGVPLYAVAVVVELIFTFVNMLFSWIPVFNMVVMVICKCIIWFFNISFYVCVLPDIKAYNMAHLQHNNDTEETSGSGSVDSEQNSDTNETPF